MPTVPVYNQPSVQEAAPNNVRFGVQPTLDSFGGGQSLQNATSAMQGALKSTADVYEAEKKKADDLATTEYFANLEKKSQDLLYHPDQGALGKKGKEAFGVQDQYGEAFDNYADELEQGLANNEQKYMARKIRMKKRAELDSTLGKHVFQETQRFDDETTNAAVSTAINKAGLNYKDPNAIADAASEASSIFDAYAGRKGMGLEESNLKKQEILSKLHSEVILRHLANDEDLGAKKYYDSVKGAGQLTAKDTIMLEDKLKDGSRLGESQRQSDALLSKYNNDFSAAIKEAETTLKEDPKLRELTVSKIEHAASRNESMRRITQENAFRNLEDILKKTGGDIGEAMKNSNWGVLSTAQQQEIKTRSRQIREYPSGEPVTDQKLFYDLQIEASTPSMQSTFAKRYLFELRSKLAERDYDQLVKLQMGIRNNDKKTLNQMKDFRSQDEIFKSTLSAFGMDPTPKDKSDDANRTNMIRNLVGERQTALQEQLGRPLNSTEFKQLVDSTLLEKTKIKGWWGYRDLKDIKIDQTERLAITQELRRKNLPATEENIIRIYQLKYKVKE